MTQLFVDTSALVKRYSKEIGSKWIEGNLDNSSGNYIILSEITMAEFAAAIASKGRAGNITLQEQANTLTLFINHCNTEYHLVGVSRIIIDRAVDLTQKYRLRGYDAVQLATALITKETIAAVNLLNNFTLLTADQDIILASQSESLQTDNPNLHP